MKKTITAVLLACILLWVAAVGVNASAGDSTDPLISVSYIRNTFLPALFEALAELSHKAAVTPNSAQEGGNGLKTARLGAGDSFLLKSGQQLILLDGGARLNIESGTVINATAGRTSTGGDARIGNRYILCGNSTVKVTVSDSALVAVSNGTEITGTGNPGKTENGEKPGATGAETPNGSFPFTDVPKNAWYYSDVSSAYQRGLVNGVTTTTYQPQSPLTVAQAIKLGACMNQLYETGKVSLANASDGRAWYMSYVDYAVQHGILVKIPDNLNGNITRADFVKLFFNTMPRKEFTSINLIMDGSIPDVPTDSEIAEQVYTFYSAGILTGYSKGNGYEEHAFGPNSTITRAEVATIMNRMFTPSARVSFSME